MREIIKVESGYVKTVNNSAKLLSLEDKLNLMLAKGNVHDIKFVSNGNHVYAYVITNVEVEKK